MATVHDSNVDSFRAHQPGEAEFRAVLPEEVEWRAFPAFPPEVRRRSSLSANRRSLALIQSG